MEGLPRRSLLKKRNEDDETKEIFKTKRRISFSSKKAIREFRKEDQAKTWDHSYVVSDSQSCSTDPTNTEPEDVPISEINSSFYGHQRLADTSAQPTSEASFNFSNINSSLGVTLLSHERVENRETLSAEDATIVTSFSLTDKERCQLKCLKNNALQEQTIDYMHDITALHRNMGWTDGIETTRETKSCKTLYATEFSDDNIDISNSFIIDKENIQPVTMNSLKKSRESKKSIHETLAMNISLSDEPHFEGLERNTGKEDPHEDNNKTLIDEIDMVFETPNLKIVKKAYPKKPSLSHTLEEENMMGEENVGFDHSTLFHSYMMDTSIEIPEKSTLRQLNEALKKKTIKLYEDDLSAMDIENVTESKNPLLLNKNEQNKATQQISLSWKQKNLRFSQADEMMLDNTNYLAQVKLDDETLSRNSSKRNSFMGGQKRETIHFDEIIKCSNDSYSNRLQLEVEDKLEPGIKYLGNDNTSEQIPIKLDNIVKTSTFGKKNNTTDTKLVGENEKLQNTIYFQEDVEDEKLLPSHSINMQQYLQPVTKTSRTRKTLHLNEDIKCSQEDTKKNIPSSGNEKKHRLSTIHLNDDLEIDHSETLQFRKTLYFNDNIDIEDDSGMSSSIKCADIDSKKKKTRSTIYFSEPMIADPPDNVLETKNMSDENLLSTVCPTEEMNLEEKSPTGNLNLETNIILTKNRTNVNEVKLFPSSAIENSSFEIHKRELEDKSNHLMTTCDEKDRSGQKSSSIYQSEGMSQNMEIVPYQNGTFLAPMDLTDLQSHDLFRISKNMSGAISSVIIDKSKINSTLYDVTNIIEESVHDYKEESIKENQHNASSCAQLTTVNTTSPNSYKLQNDERTIHEINASTKMDDSFYERRYLEKNENISSSILPTNKSAINLSKQTSAFSKESGIQSDHMVSNLLIEKYNDNRHQVDPLPCYNRQIESSQLCSNNEDNKCESLNEKNEVSYSSSKSFDANKMQKNLSVLQKRHNKEMESESQDIEIINLEVCQKEKDLVPISITYTEEADTENHSKIQPTAFKEPGLRIHIANKTFKESLATQQQTNNVEESFLASLPECNVDVEKQMEPISSKDTGNSSMDIAADKYSTKKVLTKSIAPHLSRCATLKLTPIKKIQKKISETPSHSLIDFENYEANCKTPNIHKKTKNVIDINRFTSMRNSSRKDLQNSLSNEGTIYESESNRKYTPQKYSGNISPTTSTSLRRNKNSENLDISVIDGELKSRIPKRCTVFEVSEMDCENSIFQKNEQALSENSLAISSPSTNKDNYFELQDMDITTENDNHDIVQNNKRQSINITPIVQLPKKRQTVYFHDYNLTEDIDNTSNIANNKGRQLSQIFTETVQCEENDLDCQKTIKSQRCESPMNSTYIKEDSSHGTSNTQNLENNTTNEHLSYDSIQIPRRVSNLAQRMGFSQKISSEDINSDGYNKNIQNMESNENTNIELNYKKNLSSSSIKSDNTTINPIRKEFNNLTLANYESEQIDQTRLSLIGTFEDETFVSAIEEPLAETMALEEKKTKISSEKSNLKNHQELLCKKCKHCQETFVNETSLLPCEAAFENTFPNLETDGLSELRKQKSLNDVIREGLRSSFERKTNLAKSTKFNSTIGVIPTNEKLQPIRDLKNYCMNLLNKTELTLQKKTALLQKRKSFTERLDSLLKANCTNWIFDCNFTAGNKFRFFHKKIATGYFELIYEPVDNGLNIRPKTIDLKTNMLVKRSWSAIHGILHFQLLLALPAYQDNIGKGNDERFICDKLIELDNICTGLHRLVIDLWRIVLNNKASIVRNGILYYVRKVIRTSKSLGEGTFLPQHREIEIGIKNIKELSFMDITKPALHKFQERIQTLPTGLEFLGILLDEPLQFFKHEG